MHPASPELREIVVPASISNLGPGFDALSVAVNLYLRLRVTEIRPDAPNTLEFEFDGRPPTGENRIATAFHLAKDRFDLADLPGVRVRVSCDIPIRGGLGSSAAATIAGLRLFEQLTAPRPATDWLGIATEIEGHPDNAAAALLGGLTLSCQFVDGRVHAWSWPWPAEVSFVTITPDVEVETARARQALAPTIPLRDAVFNLQRALLLVRALDTGHYDLLREALHDRWHQPVRQTFVPGLEAALALRDPAIAGVCLSGSGPTVAALTVGRADQAARALAAAYDRLGLRHTIRRLSAQPPEVPADAHHIEGVV
jgi:homoserine kinase